MKAYVLDVCLHTVLHSVQCKMITKYTLMQASQFLPEYNTVWPVLQNHTLTKSAREQDETVVSNL